MRVMNLADTLAKRGHNVTVWSTCFYHQKKIHRYPNYTSISYSPQITYHLIPSPGYSQHASIARFYDHFILGLNLFKYLLASL